MEVLKKSKSKTKLVTKKKLFVHNLQNEIDSSNMGKFFKNKQLAQSIQMIDVKTYSFNPNDKENTNPPTPQLSLLKQEKQTHLVVRSTPSINTLPSKISSDSFQFTSSNTIKELNEEEKLIKTQNLANTETSKEETQISIENNKQNNWIEQTEELLINLNEIVTLLETKPEIIKLNPSILHHLQTQISFVTK